MVERVENLIPENEWRRAYREISEFERTIADDGTVIFKFFLHINKKEQRRRFDKITKDPLTAWQVTAEDWDHHRRYNDWLLAYEEAFERTDSEYGPWTIVEATDRRYTWVKIYQTIVNMLSERLKLPVEPLPVNLEVAAKAGGEDESAEAEFGVEAEFEDELERAASQADPDVWKLEEAVMAEPANTDPASSNENTSQPGA
jgi:hypothetical protein